MVAWRWYRTRPRRFCSHDGAADFACVASAHGQRRIRTNCRAPTRAARLPRVALRYSHADFSSPRARDLRRDPGRILCRQIIVGLERKQTPGFCRERLLRHAAGYVKASSAKAVFTALDKRRVSYLVAGGIAVNAYGYLRFTKDIGFVIELSPENILEAFAALNTLGYRPNVPVTAEQFAAASNRRRWIKEKEMKVLQFWS